MIGGVSGGAVRGEAPLLAHLRDALREVERHVVYLRGHMLADQLMPRSAEWVRVAGRLGEWCG